jgi:hypothetical protein
MKNENPEILKEQNWRTIEREYLYATTSQSAAIQKSTQFNPPKVTAFPNKTTFLILIIFNDGLAPKTDYF